MADTLRLPYMPVKNARGEMTLRPYLRIELNYGKQSYSGAGLLDTGADVNVLPYPIGIMLGAVWEDQTNVLQLSGNLANYEARGIVISAVVGQFAPVRLAFAWTRAEHVPLILGQINFFMAFDVCFYRSQGVFEVHERI